MMINGYEIRDFSFWFTCVNYSHLIWLKNLSLGITILCSLKLFLRKLNMCSMTPDWDSFDKLGIPWKYFMLNCHQQQTPIKHPSPQPNGGFCCFWISWTLVIRKNIILCSSWLHLKKIGNYCKLGKSISLPYFS